MSPWLRIFVVENGVNMVLTTSSQLNEGQELEELGTHL